VVFSFCFCMLFIISTSAVDCLGRFVSEMTHYVSSGTLTVLTNQILAVVMNYRILIDKMFC